MTKYKQAVTDMMAKHQAEFEEFAKVHEVYAQDQSKWQDEFDRVGKPVTRIIEEEENRLCGKMENSGKGNYSAGLAEKFRAEIRKTFPYIDLVGVRVS